MAAPHTTWESVITAFPHTAIPPIDGPPTFASVNELTTMLKANAASIQSANGGGQLGFLGVMVSAAMYATLSTDPFIVPANPGDTPIPLAAGATSAQINEHFRAHTELLRLFRVYTAVTTALRHQILSAVPDIYLRPLRNRHTGYATVTPLQLLTHLFTTYGHIAPHDIEANDNRFKGAFDPGQPFETLVQQIDEAQDFAEAAGQPYSAAQIVSNAYRIIFQTGLFNDACREWRRKTPAQQTWQEFQKDFNIAHIDLANQRQTAQGAGYHTANNTIETIGHDNFGAALAQYAFAATADRDMLRSMQATNLALTQRLTVTEAENAQLRSQIQQFQAGLSNRSNNNHNNNRRTNNGRPNSNNNNNQQNNTNTNQPNNSNNNNNNNNTPSDPAKKRYPNLNYCWTHGCDIDPRHNSSNCRFPAPGHQNAATRDNPMGGSDKDKNKNI